MRGIVLNRAESLLLFMVARQTVLLKTWSFVIVWVTLLVLEKGGFLPRLIAAECGFLVNIWTESIIIFSLSTDYLWTLNHAQEGGARFSVPNERLREEFNVLVRLVSLLCRSTFLYLISAPQL